MTKLKLWEHQAECVKAIEEQFAGESRRTLAVLATGAGKTIIYLHLVNKWARQGARVLILAHRRELIHQPLDRAKEHFPALYARMGVVMAEEDEPEAQVVVATVQTMYRGKGRITKIKEGGKFDYVILDEAHHGTAKTYQNIVAKFSEAKWLGLTATPFRSDGDSLSAVFDSVAYRYPITSAIERGTLVPFDAYGFTLPISVKGITETVDGWAEEALGDLLSADNALEVVFEKWQEYCSDRKTICFTSSVDQAHVTADYFKAHGVKAEAVDGSTPKKVRDNVLKRFRSGALQVVVNCQVWTEGVDVPEASAALMVCPTKSDLAYVQKLGRVLRTFPNKKDALILDFAPIEDRNIVMAGDILGVPRIVKTEMKKAMDGGVMVRAARADENGLVSTVDPAEVIVQALRYLRKGILAWTLQDYLAVSTLSDTMMLAVEIPDVSRVAKAEELRRTSGWDERKERLYQSLLKHRLWVCKKDGRSWKAEFNGSYAGMDKAIAAGEKLMNFGYHPHLAKKRKQWRNRPATEAQIKYMKRLNVEVPANCTSGQAAQLISFVLANRSVGKARPSVERSIMEDGLETAVVN